MLISGLSADTFGFNLVCEATKGIGRDVVIDFSNAEVDLIDLLTIDTNSLKVGNGIFSLSEQMV